MWSKPKKGRIFVVSGPSGSGKSTILKIVQGKKEFRNNLVKIVTATTRPPRHQESPGRDYRFLEKSEFMAWRRKGAFAESQEVFGEYYGTPKAQVVNTLKSGKDALLCIDVKGALALKKVFPQEAVFVFIAVSDLRSLKERLRLRQSENQESLARRLKIAKEEMSCTRHYDYVIVNDILSQAVRKLSAIIIAERLRVN